MLSFVFIVFKTCAGILAGGGYEAPDDMNCGVQDDRSFES